MNFQTSDLDMESDAPLALMNRADAEEMDVHPLDRIRISQDGKETTIAVVDITDHLVEEGTLGLSKVLEFSGEIQVDLAEKPESVSYIREKMDGKEWTEEQIHEIVEDIDKNALSDIEMGAYASAVYMEGLSVWESIQLTKAMVDVGDQLEWTTDTVADKHSIGGVPGNRVTPIIIPIIAANGITIPKTSSRAITSPAGTADTMEAIADVSFPVERIKEIVEKTNGCLVWGGAVNLSPVDDKIIEAEYPLSLDPEGQVIASVLSKKRSVGSNHVIIDLPYGKGSKLGDIEAARDLGRKFKIVGSKLGMNIRCTITRGDQPIGRGIGPALEARDCLEVLKGEGPDDLRVKSVELADALLDLCGEEPNSDAMLDSGEALEKFRDILKEQNGDHEIEPEDIEVGEFTADITADETGRVNNLANEDIGKVASRAGAPKDHGAGLYLHKKEGEPVENGETVYTIYAENEEKLEKAKERAETNPGFRIQEHEEMLVEEF